MHDGSTKEQDTHIQSATSKHSVPAIDRAMQVFRILEQRPEGTSIREIVSALGLPRTTVYRILNSLQDYHMVRRDQQGRYTLGPRLLSLAARVVPQNTHTDLRTLAMPHLRRISEATGQSAKLSVSDGDNALVIATITGVPGLSLSVAPGQRIPLHAGAAGKILLAFLPPQEREASIQRDHASYTNLTISDPEALEKELNEIARRGWASDAGEFTPNVEAYAAGVVDDDGTTVAALSIPFLSGVTDRQREEIKAAVITAAGAISADVPRSRN